MHVWLTAIQPILSAIYQVLSGWLSQLTAHLNVATFNHIMTETCACYCFHPWLAQRCQIDIMHPGSLRLAVVPPVLYRICWLAIAFIKKTVVFIQSLVPESADIKDLGD